jgi:poly-beta-1,6-N-acetyl-D-glucosamine biosynthesis protein PgaD
VSTTPIINARHLLRWHRRLFSDATTAALWAFWLWLCSPALIAFTRLLMTGMDLRHHAAARLLVMGSSASIEGGALALAGTSGLLLVWNRLSSQPARRPALTVLPDYSGHFGIATQIIAAGRSSSICVVHHDEHGQIIDIVPRQPARLSDVAVDPGAVAPLRRAA